MEKFAVCTNVKHNGWRYWDGEMVVYECQFFFSFFSFLITFFVIRGLLLFLLGFFTHARGVFVVAFLLFLFSFTPFDSFGIYFVLAHLI